MEEFLHGPNLYVPGSACPGLVYHDDLRRVGCTVFRIDVTRHGYPSADIVCLCERGQPTGVLLGWLSGYAINATKDGNQAAAGGQQFQGRFHMVNADAGVRCGWAIGIVRKRRIHQDYRRLHVQDIVYLLGILRRNVLYAKIAQKFRPPRRQFICVNRRARVHGVHHEVAGSRAWLQYNVAAPKIRRPRQRVGVVRRRAELLKRVLLPASVLLLRHAVQDALNPRYIKSRRILGTAEGRAGRGNLHRVQGQEDGRRT